MALSTIMSRSDEDFSVLCKRLPEEYDTFREKWLEAYSERFSGKKEGVSRGGRKEGIMQRRVRDEIGAAMGGGATEA
jgi:hypothetical protein